MSKKRFIVHVTEFVYKILEVKANSFREAEKTANKTIKSNEISSFLENKNAPKGEYHINTMEKI